ncbi:MAG: deoxyguanosinetriphosphate triphosphohydrolase [Clostridiales bacterium]|nr:deoxyguanosinetriphosphate triphosphohydrolase [Clostridiales bacterium]
MSELTDYKQTTYEIEKQYLSPFAARSELSKGRVFAVPPCPMRTDFQRDRDRIIHSKCFRRLKHKTQVFLSPEGDHYRTRLTHTLEVSQIARSIARALRLNEDLTEAISLGHDLGHTPYGHAGERALNEFTPFSHNEQSLRMVDVLENDGAGMNLTFEVRDGILNHTSKGRAATLEGYVVAWSDRIAYINHDIDDAIRAGVLTQSDIPKDFIRVFGDKHGRRIDSMIRDVVSYSAGKNEVRPSPLFEDKIGALREFVFERVYRSKVAKAEEQKAIDMIKFLYGYFFRNKDKLPADLIGMESSTEQKVCDYISMMTDRFAVKLFESITVPQCWSR